MAGKYRSKSAPSQSERTAKVVVPIVVAVIGLIGVVTVPLINNDNDTGTSASGTSTRGAPSVHVVSWTIRKVPQPAPQQETAAAERAAGEAAPVERAPIVELVFYGETTGLGRYDDVFILGQFEAYPYRPTSGTPSPSRDKYYVSPPADVEDDGSWKVTWWILEEPSADASYTAVIANLSSLLNQERAQRAERPSRPTGSATPTETVPTETPTHTPTMTTPSATPTTLDIFDWLSIYGPEASDVIARDPVEMAPEHQ